MPLAAIVEDRSWFFIDAYERRGEALVRVQTRGPFQSTREKASDLLREAKEESPLLEFVCLVWKPSLYRWERCVL